MKLRLRNHVFRFLILARVLVFLLSVGQCLAQDVEEPTTKDLSDVVELMTKVFAEKSANLTLADNVICSAAGNDNSAFILGFSEVMHGSKAVKTSFIIKFDTLTLRLLWKKNIGEIGNPRDLCVSHDPVTQKTSAFICKEYALASRTLFIPDHPSTLGGVLINHFLNVFQ